MIHSSVIGMINNAALLLALCLLYDMLAFKIKERKSIIQQIITGIILGAIGLAIMSNPWSFGHGIVFDTRSVLLVISGFFFGTIPVIFAVLVTGIFRFITGGAGVWTGIAVIVTSGAIGLVWRECLHKGNQKISLSELYLIGVVVHVAMLGWMFLLPWKIAIEVLSRISFPVMLIYPVATAILGNLMVISEKRRQAQEALLVSEARLRVITDSAKDAIIMMDPEGRVTFWNPAAVQIFGFTSDEALGRNLHQLIAPQRYHADHHAAFSKFKQTGQGAAIDATLDLEACHKNGHEIAVGLSLSALCLEGGWHAVGIVRDNTARKQAEEVLRENQEDLKEAQQIAMLGNWRLNIKSNQVVWSGELYKMFGFDPTLPPPPYTEHMKLFTSESWEKLSAALQNTKDKGTSYDLELEIIRIDGSHGWIWAHGMAVLDEKKEIIALRGVAQDISDRKQSEDDLQESEARFKALHNASFGGIAIHDKGIILDCNQGLSEITGYSTDELIGMNGLLLISEKTRGLVSQNIQDGYEKPYEAMGLRKNNVEYPLRLEGRNIPYKGKNVRVVEFRDITEQKRQEEEKSQLENKLHQSQKMEAVGQLAGGVAHDFNNMLGVIIGYSEMILEQVDPSQQYRAELEQIQKAAKRSAGLTRQLLTYARKQTVAPRVLDLNETVEGMLNMLRRLIGENINLVWMPGPGLWQINMDPSQIDQILANLCVNARDAIAGVGKLTVETENATFDMEYCATHAGALPGEYVRIAVSDTGSGMDKETLAHIFEPFFTTKNVGEGTGLGLATVYGAVKQNNGFINAHSEPGQGTSFTIYLPRHVETTTETRAPAPAEPVLRGNEIVILVEDEPILLQMTKTILEHLGYIVLTAGSPSEAIILSSEYAGRIHLLVTDVIMPEMNGRQLSARLLENRPEMKCLFMSGYSANIIASQGVLKEGLSFVQKPFSKKELAIKVREALDS